MDAVGRGAKVPSTMVTRWIWTRQRLTSLAAISKGMGGSFSQTIGGIILEQFSAEMDMRSIDCDALSSFLSDSSEYAPQLSRFTSGSMWRGDLFSDSLQHALSDAHSSTQLLDGWDASSVTNMSSMFNDAFPASPSTVGT